MSVGYRKYNIDGDYHWKMYQDKEGWYYKLIQELLKNIPDKGTVLDVGCGDGLISSLLAEKGLTIEGFDGEENAIKYAQKHNPQIKSWVKDIKDITEEEMKDKSYDYMVAIEVMEHFEYPDCLVKLFDFSCRKTMYLSTDNPDTSLSRFDYHRFSIEDLQKRFRNTNIKLLYQGKGNYLVSITKK